MFNKTLLKTVTFFFHINQHCKQDFNWCSQISGMVYSKYLTLLVTLHLLDVKNQKRELTSPFLSSFLFFFYFIVLKPFFPPLNRIKTVKLLKSATFFRSFTRAEKNRLSQLLLSPHPPHLCLYLVSSPIRQKHAVVETLRLRSPW